MTVLLSIFAVLFGLAFGSFLNVCIHRLPLHQSVAHPRSHCPYCYAPIAGTDNIPIISWLILRGKCRHCGIAISPRYPLIELATAALFLLSALRFGFSIQAAGMALLCFLLLGLAAMDADTLLLPNAFTLPGIVGGILFSALNAEGMGGAHMVHAATLSLVYAAVAWSAIMLIRGAYWLMRRREGMGIGDAKLLAMIAAWLGPARTLLTLFIGVILAASFGLITIAVARVRPSARSDDPLKVPLGAFLCLAALFAVFEGSQIVAWYAGFFR